MEFGFDVRENTMVEINAILEQLNCSRIGASKKNNCRVPPIVTGRNEVLAKVIFLHLFVILFTGGGVPDQHSHPPPGPDTPRD